MDHFHAAAPVRLQAVALEFALRERVVARAGASAASASGFPTMVCRHGDARAGDERRRDVEARYHRVVDDALRPPRGAFTISGTATCSS
jgi:hypothetical protein